MSPLTSKYNTFFDVSQLCVCLRDLRESAGFEVEKRDFSYTLQVYWH